MRHERVRDCVHDRAREQKRLENDLDRIWFAMPPGARLHRRGRRQKIKSAIAPMIAAREQERFTLARRLHTSLEKLFSRQPGQNF